MRARAIVAAIAALAVLWLPAVAQADFDFLPGTEGFDAALTEADGSLDSLGGTHPYAFDVGFGFNKAGGFADGDLRDLRLELPPGLLINPTALNECSAGQFHTPRDSPFEASLSGEDCPDATQVGVIAIHSSYGGGTTRHFGLFNLVPPSGAPVAIGASPFGIPLVFIPHIREADAGLTFDLQGVPQVLSIDRLELTIWGTPVEYTHDVLRGDCLNEADPVVYHGEASTLGPGSPFHAGTCNVADPELPVALELERSYLTLPTTCDGPLRFSASARSWQGASAQASVQSHDGEGHPVDLEECNTSLFKGKTQLTTDEAAARSGLVFNLAVNDGGGILNPGGIARPAIRKAVVTLPEGLTINPSVGAGLGVCSEAEFARETLESAPGAGCPSASKVGDVEIEGMLGLPKPIAGSLFIAKPYENPFGTLLAVYMVSRSAERGIFVKSQGKIEADPRSGRLTATFEDLPRLLYTHFALTFREGQRSVVISPPLCGSYPTAIAMSSWAEPDVIIHQSAAFTIARGAAGGPCPGTADPPFHPALEAGSLNPNASSYTPFYLHMTRTDAEQEITSYSATFPPGLLGRIVGIPFCPDAAIAAAKVRTGVAELEAPSCPAQSRIGRTLAGYGVGQTLAYAPGALYLAGPYHGAPLSTVAIDSALVGPFDLGVVVVRSAIRIDRRSAQASIDPAGSDPIPHILHGIPLHLRDIRVHVDRPGFTLNPTRCDPLATLSTLTGAGADLFSAADDRPATASDRFQLANCEALGFAPRLRLSLKGRSRRGAYPTLRAVYTPRPADANIARAAVTLPPALFLAQNHIRGLCTMSQFDAGACPPGSVYGQARVFTPLLEGPLEGPVYLRSSEHTLPDLVFALRGAGGLEVDVVGRIDSVRERIRATFDSLPDAPVSRFVLRMPGQRRGVLVNADDFCASPHSFLARLLGHNNRGEAISSPVKRHCAGSGKGRPPRHGGRGGRR